ncbi:hypothetical protein jhhlp_005194 [Lomentospora prolificans]|uniref:Uncharacterized protein n=1 Tax=Lomentospora prolificans TaxID=41688 RepID=A0A2N3N739_9PEZI|nr:hypothetical protein jhhlp_005194 [Lomentospora prolificans]
MSHGPPPQHDFYYGYNDLDFDVSSDMVTALLPPDGNDELDMMAFFNNPLLTTPLDPMSMSMGFPATGDPNTLIQPFPPVAAPLMPQAGALHLAPPQGPTGMSQHALPHDSPNTLAAPAMGSDSLLPHDMSNTPSTTPMPVPPGPGPGPAVPPVTGTSAATDFTKRRNWPAKLVDEMKDLLQILDGDGRIKYVSSSVTPLLGYQPEEVMDHFIKDFVHPDDVGLVVAEMNESIATGESMTIFYRFRRKDSSYAIFEAVGHAHIAAPRFAPNPLNRSSFCQAVFVMSRPYPTKNAGLLDSFLEHKIENDRLRRRIAELRAEEDAEEAEAQREWKLRRNSSRSELSRSEETRTMASSSASGTSYVHGGVYDGSMPPPDKPRSSALTRENLEGAAGSRSDSLRDKMARYEGGSRAETIEMLTRLRYVDGERNRSSTAFRASPQLITGDAGIAIPVGREPRSGDKKKKQKLVEEYVCTDCGTLESPEWRKGPNGPKTLCNACGLRWAKKEKKKQLSGLSNAPTGAGTANDHPMTG